MRQWFFFFFFFLVHDGGGAEGTCIRHGISTAPILYNITSHARECQELCFESSHFCVEFRFWSNNACTLHGESEVEDAGLRRDRSVALTGSGYDWQARHAAQRRRHQHRNRFDEAGTPSTEQYPWQYRRRRLDSNWTRPIAFTEAEFDSLPSTVR